MHIINTFLNGACTFSLDPKIDPRGSFTRLYCQKEFNKIDATISIVQINHSYTKNKGVIRGLHFQKPPHSEAKIIKCIQGAVFDVIVDLRANSHTFLEWHGQILEKSDNTLLYVPPGFAHGYQTLDENSELIYFHTEYYNPSFEGGLRYNDPKIGIKWPLELSELSVKDGECAYLENNFTGFIL